MKKLLLILSCIPLIGIGQQILSKTTITNDTIVEYCEYYKDGGHTVTTYRHYDEWIDTLFISFDKDGDTSFTGGCGLNKRYNERN